MNSSVAFSLFSTGETVLPILISTTFLIYQLHVKSLADWRIMGHFCLLTNYIVLYLLMYYFVFRVFDLSSALGQPEQEYYLQPVELGSSHNATAICPVDFSFGGDHMWDRFSVSSILLFIYLFIFETGESICIYKSQS